MRHPGHPLMVALIVAGASIVLAASPHFVGAPTITDLGAVLRATGKIAGLGAGDVTIVLDAVGVASVQCRNPGGNVAPGQDTTVAAGGSVTLPSAKNGNVTFSVTTQEPVVTDACPNAQWTAEVQDVTFSSGTLTVLQGGVVVLTTTF